MDEQRVFTVVLSISGFDFPDVDRLMKWLECTALERDSLHRYLPDGAAVMVRDVLSNLESDKPYLSADAAYVDAPEAIMGEPGD